MDKIVALCKRRGFIFPSSEIYGGLGSTYDYGHYGVLLKTNVKNEWWRAMLQERDDIVALDSAILQHPRVWEASGHLAGFTDPLVDCRTCGQRFRADHLGELHCPRKPSQAPGRGRRLRPDRGARLQPHVRDDRRPGEGDRLGRLPAPRDRAGHLHQLQERPAVRPQEAAVRHRAGRQVVPQRDHARATSSSARASSSRWRWSSSSRRPRHSAGTTYWKQERSDWYERARHARRTTCACASTRPTSSATTRAAPPTSSTSSPSAGPSSRASPTAATSTSPSTREFSGEKLEYFDQGDGRALRAARHRAGGRRRPRDAGLPRRRLRRGGGRGRDAHRAQAPPAARADQGRGAAARAQGRPARARPRGLRRRCAASCRPSTTRAARSASATAARTRSARRGA